MTIEANLRALADDAGMAGIGFCAPDPFPEVEASLTEARATGRSGTLGFTFTDPATSANPSVTAPWARSIVVTAHSYLPAAGEPGPSVPGTGRIARFATDDHYEPLRRVLDSMADALRRAGHRAEVRCDDNRMVDRAVAVRAGVGWWGKSSMVLAPGAGPWMLLGAVITDAELPHSKPMVRDCGTCDACIPACPTGAIVAPGVIDARRCIAAILQSRGAIPRELRRLVGDRWYGCDDCLTACPPGSRLQAAVGTERGRVDLLEVLRTADRPLRAGHAHFYVPRNQPRHLRRNAIVALGNNPTDGADLVLAGLLGHPDPMLRGHAAWSLGEIGSRVAAAALEGRRTVEADADVLEEIEAALGTLA